MKSKKILQELQVSASNSNILVGSPKMSSQTGKGIQKSKDRVDIKSVEKENVLTLRRSKRKALVSELEFKAPLKTAPKKQTSKNSKAKNKKVQSVAHSSTADSKSNLTQSTMETFVSVFHSPPCSSATYKESTLFGESVVETAVGDTTLTTSECPTKAYWRDLAEQRRLALENALNDNEMLTDQITLLQNDNQLLKSALEAAEKLLQMEGLLD